MYRREALVYQKLLPAMYLLGKCEPFSPELYVASQGSTLVLEDLSADGYNPNDQGMLDLDQIKLTLQVLAQFHALGYRYLRNGIKNDPSISLIETFQPELKTGMMDQEYMYKSLCRTVKPHLSATLFDKIEKMKDELLAYSKNIHTSTPNENTMTVIIHGDLHAGNILFKYNEGKVCEAKLIDWQFTRHASPVADLIYFFIKCVHIDIFAANENDLLDSYLTTLNSVLSSLLAKRKYKREDMNRDMFQYRYIYLKLLALACRQGSGRGSWLLNIVNWLIYLEGKGFI